MYLINYLSLQTAQQIFIAAGRYRTAQNLVGLMDDSNVVFTIPSGYYVNNLPFLTIAVYLNGQRLALIDDYITVEGGGVGTGFNTVVLNEAPYPDDHLFADYVIQ